MRSIASVPNCREQGRCDRLGMRMINKSKNILCLFAGFTYRPPGIRILLIFPYLGTKWVGS